MNNNEFLNISRQYFAACPQFNTVKWERLIEQVYIFNDKWGEALSHHDWDRAVRFHKLKTIYWNAANWFYNQWLAAHDAWEKQDPFPLIVSSEETIPDGR